MKENQNEFIPFEDESTTPESVAAPENVTALESVPMTDYEMPSELDLSTEVEEDGQIARDSEDALQVAIEGEKPKAGPEPSLQQQPNKRNYEKYLEGDGFENFATPPQAPDMMPEMLKAHDTYYQAPAPAPVSPMNPTALEGLEEPVSMGEWLVCMLLMMIPCVNLVLVFVWAFSKTEKKSKSNYFKAQLIVFGVIFAIYILLFVVMMIFGIAAAL